jgi:hypothetical protein
MGLYDGIKDVAKVLQQADNVDLYIKLIDLSAQALEMQQENIRLNEEIVRLKDNSEIAKKIERHSESFLTLKDDDLKTMYCSSCWDKDNKLVQLSIHNNGWMYKCPNKDCSNTGQFAHL